MSTHAAIFTQASAPTEPADALAYWRGLFRPLVTVDETRYLLGDPSRRGLVRRLNDGTLPALDLAAPDERVERREVRIYRTCVEQLLLRPDRVPERPAPETLLPHGRPTLSRKEIAVLLNCTPRHVNKLVRAEARLGGAGGAARIERRALLEFLTARALEPLTFP